MREIVGKDKLVADGEWVPGSPLGNLLGTTISNLSLLLLLREFSQKAKDEKMFSFVKKTLMGNLRNYLLFVIITYHNKSYASLNNVRLPVW